MPSTKEKLLELSRQLQYCAVDGGCINCERWEFDCGSRKCLDDLLLKAAELLESVANGVTVQEWISVKDRLPKPFVSVLVQMPGEEPFPTVREGFISKDGIWHSALYDREPDEVTHWQPMPQPPKEGE